jgi:chemotaxis signal transduction protein
MVVDSVNSVISPAAEELSAPPDVNTGTNTDYLTNVYRSEKKLVFLIDIISLLDRAG